MVLLYDHNTKLESEALIASKYCCHISTTAHEHIVSETGMKDWTGKRPLCAHFVFPNYFHENLASFPQLTKLQDGLSFLLRWQDCTKPS